MVFDVTTDGGVTNARKLADLTKEPGEGVPDGMKVDRTGNVYGTALTGVQIFSPDGKRLGTIVTPEIAAIARRETPTARRSISRLARGCIGFV